MCPTQPAADWLVPQEGRAKAAHFLAPNPTPPHPRLLFTYSVLTLAQPCQLHRWHYSHLGKGRSALFSDLPKITQLGRSGARVCI